MAARYFIDTDVLVEYLRGSQACVEFLEGLEGDLFVSVVTVAELYSGVKGEEEERALEQFLLAFEVVPVDAQIAIKGGLYRRGFGKSHGTGLADALIGASAEAMEATLLSFNRRHYPMLKRVKVPYRRD